jgi:hypothetical protein
MNPIKKILKLVVTFVNKIFFPNFDNKICGHNPILIMRCGFMQKIIGINRSTPWPVHWTSEMIAPEKIERGERTPGFAISCLIDGRNGIVIKNNVLIAPRVSLISMNHDVNFFDSYLDSPPIVINSNSWIGANSVILPGVVLGEHTIVAASSVVTKSFPSSNQLLAGNPAILVKKLKVYKKNVAGDKS